MKRAALIIGLLGALILIALGAYLLLSSSEKGEEVVVPAEQGTNPFGFNAGSSGATGSVNGGIELALADGSVAVVPDFTKTDQPAWAGPSAGYQVAGDDDTSYLITYIPADDMGSQAQFLISLAQEPLGEVRRQAENALLQRLNLSAAELCKLDVQVWTDDSVNATYAGQDLGLSYCPGAVVLP